MAAARPAALAEGGTAMAAAGKDGAAGVGDATDGGGVDDAAVAVGKLNVENS